MVLENRWLDDAVGTDRQLVCYRLSSNRIGRNSLLLLRLLHYCVCCPLEGGLGCGGFARVYGFRFHKFLLPDLSQFLKCLIIDTLVEKDIFDAVYDVFYNATVQLWHASCGHLCDGVIFPHKPYELASSEADSQAGASTRLYSFLSTDYCPRGVFAGVGWVGDVIAVMATTRPLTEAK